MKMPENSSGLAANYIKATVLEDQRNQQKYTYHLLFLHNREWRYRALNLYFGTVPSFFVKIPYKFKFSSSILCYKGWLSNLNSWK